MDKINQPTAVDNPTDDSTVVWDAGIPETTKPWAWVLNHYLVNKSISGPLRQMPDQQLRHMAASTALHYTIVPYYLEQWNLPQLEEPGFWDGTVLPAIRSELNRRQRPNRTWGGNSPIARLKRLDLAEVAARFTELSGSGNRLRGKCPVHDEQTPSFVVYQDRQKWRCFGACADGGDVIDLLRRLGNQGKLQ